MASYCSQLNAFSCPFGNQHGMGLQLGQLDRDASTAGAAVLLGSQNQSLEVVESVADDEAKATNWASFSATAGLGVIHHGHLQQGRSFMAPYLPQNGSSGGSPYSESESLCALGLL
ncbi:hypothetical protein CTI12_AA159730 [Artemisia annua]|uniref:Uncharacterized protein n=1 Tax=Artemisia annua TaxID=35608 RepID=A0A2U1PF58_ARTAN|nr:hypothetical protein CTI12_AA159730 [Artemisia annua]